MLPRCMSGENSITRGVGEKNSCTNQITHPQNTPPPPPPPPPSPQNSNSIAAFDFVFMLPRRRTKENKATNQNLRYVIYNIYIKFYILRQEIELGK